MNHIRHEKVNSNTEIAAIEQMSDYNLHADKHGKPNRIDNVVEKR